MDTTFVRTRPPALMRLELMHEIFSSYGWPQITFGRPLALLQSTLPTGVILSNDWDILEYRHLHPMLSLKSSAILPVTGHRRRLDISVLRFGIAWFEES